MSVIAVDKSDVCPVLGCIEVLCFTWSAIFFFLANILNEARTPDPSLEKGDDSMVINPYLQLGL